MPKQSNIFSFESLFERILTEEISNLLDNFSNNQNLNNNKYLTLKELSVSTGIGTYTLRQLTYSRAMPHRRVRSRLIFDENEVTGTITNYKNYGWNDPDKNWDVKTVQSEIDNLRKTKESPLMIDEILRKIIREELTNFSNELKNVNKKDKENFYGRTVLTIKEAANHFRTSPNTIYSLIKEEGMPHFKIQSRFYIVLEEAEAYLWRETAKSYATEGNIYWQRILQRLDWEEKERNLAFENALKRLEHGKF
ncbi:helix-turn-helix domain-containing protein [Cytobacillus sp. FJAT-54145]|uniref:Helix-turn-helix domain-containing protein n=1 Tax=Cytobacillus spartinae TaxID=3299023 RepID=A0ABW6KFB3_9BACI